MLHLPCVYSWRISCILRGRPLVMTVSRKSECLLFFSPLQLPNTGWKSILLLLWKISRIKYHSALTCHQLIRPSHRRTHSHRPTVFVEHVNSTRLKSSHLRWVAHRCPRRQVPAKATAVEVTLHQEVGKSLQPVIVNRVNCRFNQVITMSTWRKVFFTCSKKTNPLHSEKKQNAVNWSVWYQCPHQWPLTISCNSQLQCQVT